MCLNALRAPAPSPADEAGSSGDAEDEDKDKENGDANDGGGGGAAAAAATSTKGGDAVAESGARAEETEEEKEERLAEEASLRESQQARHEEDVKWHNGDTYAAVIAVLKSLSAEVDVCRSLVSTPGGLERVIAVLPETFGTVEEGALLLSTICERGNQSHLRFDDLVRVGLLEKMKDISAALAMTPRPQRKVAMKAAEAALLCLPVTEYLPPLRPPPPNPPPSPPPNPMPTWRNKMTRNVDCVLPLHTVLPETWRLCDEEGIPVVGDALVGAINALVGECVTEQALADVAATVEAPTHTLAALKCILTILGDANFLEGDAAAAANDAQLWEAVRTQRATGGGGGKGAKGGGGGGAPGDAIQRALTSAGKLAELMQKYAERLEEANVELVGAAKAGLLSGVYVAGAEAESAAAGAMLKWAYTVCHCVESAAAAKREE